LCDFREWDAGGGEGLPLTVGYRRHVEVLDQLVE
jgi:hypothetical protein